MASGDEFRAARQKLRTALEPIERVGQQLQQTNYHIGIVDDAPVPANAIEVLKKRKRGRPREDGKTAEVARLVKRQLSDTEIAERMNLSVSGLRHHLGQLAKKQPSNYLWDTGLPYW